MTFGLPVTQHKHGGYGTVEMQRQSYRCPLWKKPRLGTPISLRHLDGSGRASAVAGTPARGMGLTFEGLGSNPASYPLLNVSGGDLTIYGGLFHYLKPVSRQRCHYAVRWPTNSA